MKISIYIASSANGFISNSRGIPDWLSPEYGQGFYSICQRTQAVIMGRTSYDILAPDHLPLKTTGKTVVLTRNKTIEPANATVVFTDDSPVAIVEQLEQEGYTEAVIIGGAMAISTFLNAGVVSEIYFVIEPALFASGLPLLQDGKADRKLKLIEVTRLNDNTVQLHYAID